MNISNRFLDLRYLVATQAGELGMLPLLAVAGHQFPERSSSVWMLLTQPGPFTDQEWVRERCGPWKSEQQVLWTDGYSNLFSVLRFRKKF